MVSDVCCCRSGGRGLLAPKTGGVAAPGGIALNGGMALRSVLFAATREDGHHEQRKQHKRQDPADTGIARVRQGPEGSAKIIVTYSVTMR